MEEKIGRDKKGRIECDESDSGIGVLNQRRNKCKWRSQRRATNVEELISPDTTTHARGGGHVTAGTPDHY